MHIPRFFQPSLARDDGQQQIDSDVTTWSRLASLLQSITTTITNYRIDNIVPKNAAAVPLDHQVLHHHQRHALPAPTPLPLSPRDGAPPTPSLDSNTIIGIVLGILLTAFVAAAAWFLYSYRFTVRFRKRDRHHRHRRHSSSSSSHYKPSGHLHRGKHPHPPPAPPPPVRLHRKHQRARGGGSTSSSASSSAPGPPPPAVPPPPAAAPDPPAAADVGDGAKT